MTRKQYASLLLALIALFAAWRHLANRPDPTSPERAITKERAYLATQYLAFQQASSLEFKVLDRFLQRYWKKSGQSPAIGEVIALIYGLEANFETYERILGEIDGDYDRRKLDYALKRTDLLPEQWRDSQNDDWAGLKTAALIYDRLDDQEGRADASIKLQLFKTQARRYYQSFIFLEILQWLGVGLAFSMGLAYRRFQRAGTRYFNLTPLYIAPASLLRFCGLFLLAFIVVSQFGQWALADTPAWGSHALIYFAQVVAAVFLVKYLLYNDKLTVIFEVLGFTDLKMRAFNFIQILGGVAILTACNQTALFLGSLIQWPAGDVDAVRRYGEIMREPLSGVVFITTVCLAAPLFEEFLFRGLIFRGLLASQRPWRAFLLSSMLFMLLHPLAYWPSVFFMGLGLALIYYRTANLMVNIWTHALWNCIMLFLALIDAGY